jgi:hypothetical protein
MKITEVYYQRNFQIGEFTYEHYGVKISISGSDNIDDAYNEAERIVKEQHYAKNKDYYAMLASQNVPIDLPVTQAKEYIENHPYISSESDLLQEMQSYKLGSKAFIAVYGEMVKGNPKLEEAYKNKLNELSNN